MENSARVHKHSQKHLSESKKALVDFYFNLHSGGTVCLYRSTH